MKLCLLKNHLFEQLSLCYESAEAHAIAYRVLEAYGGYSKLDIALNPRVEVCSQVEKQIEQALVRLSNNEPLQYILGETYFYSNDFKVTSDTLIPRPETEELVDWIIKDYSNSKDLQVLDIGTGTGCIAISLAKHLNNAKVSAIDVSEKALLVAQENAKRVGVSVDFIGQNILESNELPQKYDIIVSNPPYVRNSEKEAMKANVLDYEPDIALYVSDEDPLIFYLKIARLFLKHANSNACLYFEINEYLGESLKKELIDMGVRQVILKKDFTGRDRMMKVFL